MIIYGFYRIMSGYSNTWRERNERKENRGAADGRCAADGRHDRLLRLRVKGTLKIATNAEFDPMGVLENRRIVGADMDIIRAVADKMGMKVEIQNMEFEAVLSALVSKSCDVAVAGLTVNKKRAEQVDFSSAYYKVSQMLIVRNDDTVFTGATKEELDEQLKGKKIGVCTGYTGQQYVEGDPDWPFEPIENAQAVIYDNISLAIQGLKDKAVDVVMMDDAVAKQAAAADQNKDAVRIIDVKLTDERYAIGVQKGNTELMEKVNKALEELRSEGEIAKILAKYDMEEPADL